MTRPEKWVVVKIENPNEKDPLLKTVHKVFASWAGGYLDGDKYKMNSGIDRITEDENTIQFYGYSGSCYECQKGAYGTMTSSSDGILDNIISIASSNAVTITVLPEETDWLNL